MTTDLMKDIRDALDKLARLGNEPELGNSIGNVIAQQALQKLDALGDGWQSLPWIYPENDLPQLGQRAVLVRYYDVQAGIHNYRQVNKVDAVELQEIVENAHSWLFLAQPLPTPPKQRGV